MCGRFGHTNTDKEKIKKRFRLKKIDFKLIPQYNIAPSANISVILNESPNTLSQIRWGLVPFWSKDVSIGQRMINARAETITEKPAFRRSIKRKRCLILTDGFYEWQKRKDGKHPHRICRKDEALFAFAGIWDEWEKGDRPLRTCSIITTAPNDLLQPIHDRMPVIIPEDKEAQWLDDISLERVQELLKPYPNDDLKAYEISKLVNSPEHNAPEVIEAIG